MRWLVFAAVLPCALAACARAPAPVVSLNAEPLPPSEQAWRDTIAPADQALLEELPSIWTQVLATARKRSAAKIDAEGPLLERSEEHTSELQSLMRISYAVFCLKKKTQYHRHHYNTPTY